MFDSTTIQGRKVIFTELSHGDKNFVVAMELNAKRGAVEINSVRSVYPRNNTQIIKSFANNEATYIDKQKAKEWLDKQQSNSVEFIQLSNRSANIINDFQNPITNKSVDYQFLKENDFDANGNVKPEVLTQIKAERENIIKQAQANGTYLKAPNGQNSKLNEDQWVSVRTQRFKDWFGDWESVSLIQMAENAWNGSDKHWTYRFAPSPKLASKFSELLGQEILSVGITDSAVRHIKKNHGENEEKRGQINKTASDIAVLPYILNNFDIAELSTPDRLGNPTIEFKKITNGVASVITVALGKNKEFVVTAWEEKSSASMKKSLMPNALSDLDLAKIQKDIENIKNSTNNVSKVVDENGEPLVVYHGARSSERFNTFSKTHNGIYFTSNMEVAEAFQNETAFTLTINGEEFVLDIDSAFDLKSEIDPYVDFSDIMGYNLAEDTSDNLNEALYNGALQIGFDGEITSSDEVILRKTDNPFFEVFLNIKAPKTADFEGQPWGGKNGTIEEKLDRSKDGFIAENISEGGLVEELPLGDTYVVFNSNQIKSATDNIGTFSEESDDIRYQIIGEKGASHLDQHEETTHRTDNLATAKEMEAQGKSAQEIYHATGWEKGKDNKWRYNESI